MKEFIVITEYGLRIKRLPKKQPVAMLATHFHTAKDR